MGRAWSAILENFPTRRSRIAAISVVVVLFTGAALGLYALGRGTLVQTAYSPDKRWVVRVYYINVGAMDGGAYRATATRQGGGTREVLRAINLERLEYEGDLSETLQIEWLTGDTARIGGYVVDLARGHVVDF